LVDRLSQILTTLRASRNSFVKFSPPPMELRDGISKRIERISKFDIRDLSLLDVDTERACPRFNREATKLVVAQSDRLVRSRNIHGKDNRERELPTRCRPSPIIYLSDERDLEE